MNRVLFECELPDGESGLAVHLVGAKLSSAQPATPEQAVANLDRVREIILADVSRLDMAVWHETKDWRARTCAEEAACETTHCLAGWLQVCSTDPEIRLLDPQVAGIMCARVAAGMFFAPKADVLRWLETRAYAKEAR